MSVLAAVLFASLAGAAPEGASGFVVPDKESLSIVFGARWKADVSSFEFLAASPEEWSTPYISEDGVRAFAGARTGILYARDLIEGKTLFEKKGLGAIGYGMGEYQGLLLVGSDSDLLALDQVIGGERFRVPLGGRIGGPMTVTGTVALIPVRPNAVVAIDLEARKELWRQKRPTPDGISIRGQGKPVVDAKKGRMYVGYSDGALAAIDLRRGDVLWTATLGKPREFFADVDVAPVIVDKGKALIAASYNGGLFKVDAETGRTIWSQEVFRIMGLVDAGSGLLVASEGDGLVLGIYRKTGVVRWRYKQKSGWPTAPVVVGRQLVAVGSSNGPVAFLDVDTGQPKQLFSLGNGVSVPPFYRDPDLLVLSNQGAFVALRYGSGISVTR